MNPGPAAGTPLDGQREANAMLHQLSNDPDDGDTMPDQDDQTPPSGGGDSGDGRPY